MAVMFSDHSVEVGQAARTNGELKTGIKINLTKE